MLRQHHHEPGIFDAGHFRACARQAGLLGHYRQVQQEETTLREAQRWARAATGVPAWHCGRPVLRPCWPSSPS